MLNGHTVIGACSKCGFSIAACMCNKEDIILNHKGIICKICGKKCKNQVSYQHLRIHGITTQQYKEKFHLSTTLSEEAYLRSSKIRKGTKVGINNPAKNPKVREKISESLKKIWKEGVYKDRINGMFGLKGELNHNFDPRKHTPVYLAEHKYKNFLAQYEDITKCRRCGKTKKINIHHVDEDRANFLPSNLEPLCVPCHTSFHYSLQKQPFLTIGKKFTFASAHRLPKYKGSCSRWHGHEFTLEVCIRKRVDKKTGMVLDFSLLKEIVTKYIIKEFDHNVLNDFLPNPTAENILIWIWEKLIFEAHLKGIEQITLWETPTSPAILTKEGMLSIFSDNIEKYDLYKEKN